MLIGQIEGKISDKYQVAFPKRFRVDLGEKLIVTKGFEGYLIVVSEKSWKMLLEGTSGRPFTDKHSREVQRYLLGNAASVVLDDKGRFVVPEYLRRHANLKEDVVFAGIERYVEIWDKETWEKYQKELGSTIVSVAERLNEEEHGRIS